MERPRATAYTGQLVRHERSLALQASQKQLLGLERELSLALDHMVATGTAIPDELRSRVMLKRAETELLFGTLRDLE